jgi:anti-sigma B factor antagonist
LSIAVDRNAAQEVVLHLSGELDALSLPRLFRAVAEGGAPERLILDLRNVSFCSATGLQALAELGARRALAETLIVIAAPRVLRRLLHLTGVAGRVHVCESVREARQLDPSAADSAALRPAAQGGR